MSRRQGKATRSCLGKRPHADEASALRHVWRLVNAGERRRDIRHYHCKHCDSYHVGHSHGRGKRRR